METARLNRLQENGGAALRRYEALLASRDWPAVADFQHAYQENPEAVEAAAEAAEAAAAQTKGKRK